MFCTDKSSGAFGRRRVAAAAAAPAARARSTHVAARRCIDACLSIYLCRYHSWW